MAKPTTTLISADRPHSQALLSGLALVPSSVDHHADDDAIVIQALADAVACGDRDVVFDLVTRLVGAGRVDTKHTDRPEDKRLAGTQLKNEVTMNEQTELHEAMADLIDFVAKNATNIRFAELDDDELQTGLVDYVKIAEVVRTALAESHTPEPLRVDLKEICRRFCVSRSTIYRYMEQGGRPF
jgi:hypothetical protein